MSHEVNPPTRNRAIGVEKAVAVASDFAIGRSYRRFSAAAVLGMANCDLRADPAKHASAIDKPIAGPLIDLKTRGLLNDTLRIGGGELSRTPHAQNGNGRDPCG